MGRVGMAALGSGRTSAGNRVQYDMLPRQEVPRRISPGSLQWKEIVERCVAEARKKKEKQCVAKIIDLGGRTPHGVVNCLSGFVLRHPEPTEGFRIRTQTSKEEIEGVVRAIVYVWATPRIDPVD